MIKSLLPLLLFLLSALTSFSQTNSSPVKECRISAGVGIASGTHDTKTIGRDTWMQLSYTIANNVSVATEFENMNYKSPGYYKNLPVEPN